MPTTFNVVSLGNFADLDTNEGDNVAENSGSLVGTTFGGVGDSLVKDFVTFAPGSTGFSGGRSTAYDQDNAPAETFTIDGGPEQTFDSTVVYNATITYIDGTTATITAVIFQDTDGNLYWAPEFSPNADQTDLEALPIRSLTLNNVSSDTYAGMAGNRQTWAFAVCFASGTRIETPNGRVFVEALQTGDPVLTRDGGAKRIRWIGRRRVPARDAFAPVRIAAGALGAGLPERDLVVSQQHRILLASKIAERMTGAHEVLVAAKKLVGRPGIALVTDMDEVTYHHILLDAHEIVFAEGAATESLLAGPMALASFNAGTLAEIRALFPDFEARAGVPARPIVTGKPLKTLLARHEKNGRALVEG